MSVTAIVGANWGDEGKGRITDYMAADADFVVRFQGGNNAGHTVICDYGRFALHLLPCGVFRQDVTNVLGPGVAVNVSALLEEMDALVAGGVPRPRLFVSNRAEVVMPYHAMLDQCEEERLGPVGFGSTRVGIAPFYADKYMKTGVQVADLYDRRRLLARVEASLAAKNVLFEHLYRVPPLDAQETVDHLLKAAEALKPYVADTTALLHDALRGGKRILLEGQLGALRDPDHGIYPYPTSSSPLAGFASVGAGIPPWAITRVIAVVKAYSTCVGAGPFVTELAGQAGDELRARGGDRGEYGATTGRARRVGWFDTVATRYGCLVQGATEVALTMLDVLSYLDEIPLCTAYELDGARVTDFPVTAAVARARPVYEAMPGWKSNLSGIRQFDRLPAEAHAYVRRIEELIGVPVSLISVGPRRDELIRMPLFAGIAVQ